MANPAEVLDTIVANSGLYQVPYADIAALGPVPEYERWAAGHWLFDRNSDDNLIDRISGLPLVPAGTAPLYSADHLTTVTGGMHGLLTPFDDAETMTVCGVFRRRALGGGITGVPLFASATQTVADGGSIAYDFTGPTVSMRTMQGAAKNIAGTSAIAANEWFFAGMVAKPNVQIYFAGGFAAVGDTVAKTVSARKLAIGNASVNSGIYFQGVEVFEFMAAPGVALSIDDLADTYARSKIRAARRSLAVH